jgi:FAD/FMN-containing dehydrogenase
MKDSSADSISTQARSLQGLMKGKVIAEGQKDYAEARLIWNSAVQHRPAMIAFCESVEDVQAAIRSARAHGLPISVRGAGHDVAGRSVQPRGLVIDLSRMNRVKVDGLAATVGGGATAAAVIAAASAHDLTAVTGWNGVVGMTGLALVGGYGPLLASHGLALDSLEGAEVVLADGRSVTANAVENPDLFWALQGGGGNFGVVTSMKIRLYPHRPILGGMILFPWTQADAVLGGYSDAIASVGNDLTVVMGVFTLPDGNPTLFLAPVWTGETAQGEVIMAALQSLGTPFHAQISTMRYQDLIGLFDSRVATGLHHAVENRWIPRLTREVISTIVKAAGERSSPHSAIILQHFRGAPARIPLEATAFGLRREHFLVEIISSWTPDPADHGAKHRSWAADFSRALAPASFPGGYLAMLHPEQPDRIMESFGSNLPKLRDVKRHYDPDGVFSATPLPA